MATFSGEINTARKITGLRSRRHAGLCCSKCPKRMLPVANRLMNTATSNQGVSIVHMRSSSALATSSCSKVPVSASALQDALEILIEHQALPDQIGGSGAHPRGIFFAVTVALLD